MKRFFLTLLLLALLAGCDRFLPPRTGKLPQSWPDDQDPRPARLFMEIEVKGPGVPTVCNRGALTVDATDLMILAPGGKPMRCETP